MAFRGSTGRRIHPMKPTMADASTQPEGAPPPTPAPAADERRSAPRTDAAGVISALGEVKDISATGMRVLREGKLPVSVGATFKLEIQLGDRVVMLPAEMIHGASVENDHVEMGIAFGELSPGQTAQLADILDQLQAPHDLQVTCDPHHPQTQQAEEAIRVAEDILDDLDESLDDLQGLDDDEDEDEANASSNDAPTWYEAMTGQKLGHENNRRRHGRLTAQDTKSSLGIVMDISCSGLRVRRKGRPPISVGETFMIDLNAAGRVLRAPITLIYIRKIGWRTYDYGLEFGDIPDEIRSEFSQLARMASKAVEIF